MIKKKSELSIRTYTKGRLFRIKLRGKLLNQGRRSLYLDHYRGSGQKREIEFLNIIIKENPSTIKEREYNKEQMNLALAIRERRESNLKHESEGLISPAKKKLNFIDYYQDYLNNYSNKDLRIVKYSFVHFKKCIDEIDYLAPYQITPELVTKYKNHLLDNLNGETPLNYYTKFKGLCKKAFKERILDSNPCEGISIPKDDSIKKAILNYNEINQLALTDCGVKEVKRAFLFGCNTALGFDELKNLKWKNIDAVRSKMTYQRNKVKNTSSKSINHLDLNLNALKLLGERGDPNELIFKLKSYVSSSKALKRWVKAAGIEKNVTWHSARHSAATNLLIGGADLKTVSSVLSHSSLKHTAKYLHLVDEQKKNAMDSIPPLNLDSLAL